MRERGPQRAATAPKNATTPPNPIPTFTAAFVVAGFVAVVVAALVAAGVVTTTPLVVVPDGVVSVVVPLDATLVEVTVVDPVVAVTVAVFEAEAENPEHTASPADCADKRSVNAQAPRRHGATVAERMALVGPHWQATSVAAQPTAEMAEARQEVWGWGGQSMPGGDGV